MAKISNRLLKRLPLVLLWVAAFCILDLAVKFMIVNHLLEPPRSITVTSFFNLTLAYNPGVSFGLFSETMGSAPRLFAALQGVIVVGLVIWATRTTNVLEGLAIVGIAGGASGNVVDRFLNNSVTDYLDFHAFGWSWPTFNLADVMIVCGSILVVATSGGAGTAHPQTVDHSRSGSP